MSESINKPKTQGKKQAYRLYAQYVLIGAALGAYYGIPSKFPRESIQYYYIVLYSIISGGVVTTFQVWKKGYSGKEKLVVFLKSFGMFFLFLAVLNARPFIEKWGGDGLVLAFTTLMGALVGFILGLKKKPVANKTTETKK